MTRDGNNYPSYDNSGNLTQLDGTYFAWDERGQLYNTSPSKGGNCFSPPYLGYTYDALGRRVVRLFCSGSSSPSTKFLYDGLNPLQEQQTGGPTYNSVLGTALDDRFVWNGLTLLSDALNSTLGLVNSTGNLVDTYQYDPYGNTTVLSGTDQSPYAFTGRENEGSGNNLYYLRNRYYSPAIGRFISPDPAGTPGSNLYMYAGDDPVDFSDPAGLDFPPVSSVGVGGSYGGPDNLPGSPSGNDVKISTLVWAFTDIAFSGGLFGLNLNSQFGRFLRSGGGGSPPFAGPPPPQGGLGGVERVQVAPTGDLGEPIPSQQYRPFGFHQEEKGQPPALFSFCSPGTQTTLGSFAQLLARSLGRYSAPEGAAEALGFSAGTIAGFAYGLAFVLPARLTLYFACK